MPDTAPETDAIAVIRRRRDVALEMAREKKAVAAELTDLLLELGAEEPEAEDDEEDDEDLEETPPPPAARKPATPSTNGTHVPGKAVAPPVAGTAADKILRLLAKEGPLTQKEIVTRSGCAYSTVSPVLNRNDWFRRTEPGKATSPWDLSAKGQEQANDLGDGESAGTAESAS